MIFLSIVVFIALAFFELPKLIKNHYRKDAVTFVVLLAIGFILTLLQLLNIEIPSPTKGIIFITKNVLGLNFYEG